jgi:hypothetical protein
MYFSELNVHPAFKPITQNRETGNDYDSRILGVSRKVIITSYSISSVVTHRVKTELQPWRYSLANVNHRNDEYKKKTLNVVQLMMKV